MASRDLSHHAPSETVTRQSGRELAHGYCVLEDVYDAQTIDFLLATLAFYEAHPEIYAAPLEFQYEPGPERSVRKMRRLAWVDPEPWSLLWKNPTVLAWLADYFQEEVRVAFCAAFLKPAGIGTRIPYHQDQALWARELPRALSFWVALQDTDEANGCLVLCPDSHSGGLLPHAEPPDQQHPEVVPEVLGHLSRRPMPLRRGSALGWDRFMVHGSGANRSPRPRKAVVTVFAPGRLLSSADPLVWKP